MSRLQAYTIALYREIDGSFRRRLAVIAKINVLPIDNFAIAPIGPREL